MRVTIANELAKRGFTVDLVLANARGPNLKDIVDNVNVVDLDSPRVLHSLLPLSKYIRSKRPDVVLSAMNYANIIAALACWLSRTPVRLVASEHANFGSWVDGSVRIKQKIVFKLLRFAYRRVDSLIAVSEAVADDVSAYTGYPKENIKIIYNPVFSDDLVLKSKQYLEHAWFADPALHVIVAAGRLTEVKAFDVLIEGFSLAHKKNRNTRLVILGDGELLAPLQEKAVEAMVEDEVDFVGFVENPYPYMAQSSVFVLSSRMESFGNVLVEAMACGAPVVSTSCRGGPVEILEGGRWGRLVPVGDPLAIADAILSYLSDGSRPAVKLRAEYFSVQRAVDAYAMEIQDPPNIYI